MLSRNGLAKVSSTPGKTRTLNFFNVNDALYFVDVPGYGYAKVTPLFQSKNNYLLNLETDYGAFDKEFSPFEMEYTLTLDKYEQHFTLTGTSRIKD